MALQERVRERCTGIPQAWPEKELTQVEVEKYARRDAVSTAACASTSLSYVDHIQTRDKALSGKKK